MPMGLHSEHPGINGEVRRETKWQRRAVRRGDRLVFSIRLVAGDRRGIERASSYVLDAIGQNDEFVCFMAAAKPPSVIIPGGVIWWYRLPLFARLVR
jgi:hypothetical protein